MRKITKSNFVGNPSILFFGFTNCPDVCPTTLNDLSLLLDKLGDKGKILKYILLHWILKGTQLMF